MKSSVGLRVVLFLLLIVVVLFLTLIVMSWLGVGIDTKEMEWQSKKAHAAVVKAMREIPEAQLSQLDQLAEGDAATSYVVATEELQKEGDHYFDGLAETTHTLNRATSVKRYHRVDYTRPSLLDVYAGQYVKLIRGEQDFAKRKDYLNRVFVLLSHSLQCWDKDSGSGFWDLNILLRYLFALTNFFSDEELEELGYSPAQAHTLYAEADSAMQSISVSNKSRWGISNWNVFTWRFFKP